MLPDLVESLIKTFIISVAVVFGLVLMSVEQNTVLYLLVFVSWPVDVPSVVSVLGDEGDNIFLNVDDAEVLPADHIQFFCSKHTVSSFCASMLCFWLQKVVDHCRKNSGSEVRLGKSLSSSSVLMSDLLKTAPDAVMR